MHSELNHYYYQFKYETLSSCLLLLLVAQNMMTMSFKSKKCFGYGLMVNHTCCYEIDKPSISLSSRSGTTTVSKLMTITYKLV